MRRNACVIGVDFGTESVRSVIAHVADGSEVASSVFFYPRWQKGLYCDPSRNQFRQHPLDYLEGLEATIGDCLRKTGPEIVKNIKAMSIDTTGSTPVAVDECGVPLALKSGFETNPNAMFMLWKDHTAIDEAAEINNHANKFEINYLKHVGGIYSSEWYWAKLLHVLKNDEAVKNSCYSWVEHSDWIPFLLTGGEHLSTMKRNVCAAGHKALWSEEFGGLPPKSFFASLDVRLADFTSGFEKVYAADKAAGKLSKEWSKKLGLPSEVLVGIGSLDAHMGAVGGQIEPYYLSKVMGTSTCDMLVVPPADLKGKLVKGICGQVHDSIVPGMVGMEAGQSAFGDVYAWFRDFITWSIDSSNVGDESDRQSLSADIKSSILNNLGEAASLRPINECDELAIDWFNGRRTPDANPLVKGAVSGLNLSSDPVSIYKSIVEATCFGAKRIVERFIAEGIAIHGIIGVGGVAKKSPFVMQMMADVLDMVIKVHKSEQTTALGTAMFAATIAGFYQNVQEAMDAMGQGFETEYLPNQKNAQIHTNRYQKYIRLSGFIESQLTD